MRVERKRRRRLKPWVKQTLLFILLVLLFVILNFSLKALFTIYNTDKNIQANTQGNHLTSQNNKPSTEDNPSVIVQDNEPNEIVENDSNTPSGQENPNPIVETNPYQIVTYYIDDNLDRYEAFQQLNPSYDVEEVVWQVNAKLDKPFYTDITIIEDLTKTPILVNKYRQLPSYYVPILVEVAGGYLVTEQTRDAFYAMTDAMRQVNSNYKLYIISSYRSYETQDWLFHNYENNYGVATAETFSARPGHSEHQLGEAIDVQGSTGVYTDFDYTIEYPWVLENAHRFGFIISYQSETVDITGYQFEPWHLRYVGVEIATDMREKGIQYLEEYLIKFGQ